MIGGFCIIFMVFFIVVLIFCFFFFNRFEDDIQYMIGFRLYVYWRICWRYVLFFFIFVIFIVSIINLVIIFMIYLVWDFNFVSVLVNFF